METVLDVFRIFFNCITAFFTVYLIGYSTFIFCSVVVGSSELYKGRRRRTFGSEFGDEIDVPVSIIVPAYNEEVTIESTVISLLSLDYKTYEIIVVDDGSKDSTSETLIRAFHMHRLTHPIQRRLKCKPEEAVYETMAEKVPLTLIRKKNGGKADSLNMGINAARYPYFVCMDADSILQYDSLRRITYPVLEDDSVVAVGGAVRPCNGCEIEKGRVVKYSLPKNILACMQVLEYDRSFLAARMLFDKFNGNLIISGAFGLFKKDTVIAAGGYDATTMGEDMELVVKLHEYCREHSVKYRIKYAYDAICWSQAPEKLSDLRKQRRRWHIGLFQSMVGHRKIFFNPKFGPVGFISYTYFLIYELLSPYIEVFSVFVMVGGFFAGLVNIPFMLLFFVIYALYSSVLSLTAFFSRVQTTDMDLTLLDVMKAILLCFFEISFLRFVLAFERATALIGYKRKKNKWGKIERKKIQIKK